MSPLLAVDGWAPEVGSALPGDDHLPAAPGEVDVTVERPAADWSPVAAPAVAADVPVRFVDGVRRIEGIVWELADGAGDRSSVRQGLAVSLAAGSVRCDGPRAEITTAVVQRLLIGPSGLPPVVTTAGTFEPRAVADDDPDVLRRGVQERLRRLERRILDDGADADLVVLDGPLDGSVEVPHAVGYVKTHQVGYLPDEVRDVVAALAPGERTPLFLAQSSWTRFSWYLRLPYGSGHPWAGVVRCEASADLDAAGALALAERTAALLPRFASRPHKDRRAPQNLYPIGGLERQLRHRLGDPAYVLRALRAAVAGAPEPAG